MSGQSSRILCETYQEKGCASGQSQSRSKDQSRAGRQVQTIGLPLFSQTSCAYNLIWVGSIVHLVFGDACLSAWDTLSNWFRGLIEAVGAYLPFHWKAFGSVFSTCVIQHIWQKCVCECAPNPPILWAAGVSQTPPNNITLTWWPSGQLGLHTTIPSSHRQRRSLTMIQRYRWSWSGFCSLGPGIMPESSKFEVWNLEDYHRKWIQYLPIARG